MGYFCKNFSMNINFLNRKIVFAFDNLSLFYWNLFLISKIDINLIENFGWKSDDWLHFVNSVFERTALLIRRDLKYL